MRKELSDTVKENLPEINKHAADALIVKDLNRRATYTVLSFALSEIGYFIMGQSPHPDIVVEILTVGGLISTGINGLLGIEYARDYIEDPNKYMSDKHRFNLKE